MKRRTSPESAARLLAQHGLEEEALTVLLEGSGKPQPPPQDGGGSSNKDSAGSSAPASAEGPAATGSTPMLATTWDLLRSLLRQVLQHDAAAAGRARAMLEGWKTCPDPQRQVCPLPEQNGGLNGVSRFVLSDGRAGGGRLTGEPPSRSQSRHLLKLPGVYL